MLLSISAIAVLLLLSALFSGSETAFTAASRLRLHALESEGDRRATMLGRLRERREQVIQAILVGNNLVNILASALATSMFIGIAGDAGVFYATIAMTALVVVFAEVLPKTYAIHRAEFTALAMAPFLRIVLFLFGPLCGAMGRLIRTALRPFGVAMGEEVRTALTEEELRGAIELHRGPSADVPHERAMLRSIMELDQVEVGEIMVHRGKVTIIDAGAPAPAIVEQVLASPYTRFPLWRDDPDNIVGVLHTKDLLRAVQVHWGELDRLEVEKIAAPSWFVPESTRLLDQLQAFRRRREHFALVVDEYGSLMGIVTLEDIIEEIVGDIVDEHDRPVRGVRPQADGSYIVDGTVTIRDLNRQFEWRLPDEEAATIAGLVLHESRQIPEAGQEFVFFGYRFEVLHRVRNQIASIRITPPSTKSEADTGLHDSSSPSC
jgi:Mg2+/Co2+ transporter CorB